MAMYITADIAHKALGPIRYLAKSVDYDLRYGRASVACLAVVHLDIFRRGECWIRLSYAPLQTPHDVFTVALDDQLQIARLRDMEHKISKQTLCIWMQMKFRLFQ